jgi:hypothetical protein
MNNLPLHGGVRVAVRRRYTKTMVALAQPQSRKRPRRSRGRLQDWGWARATMREDNSRLDWQAKPKAGNRAKKLPAGEKEGQAYDREAAGNSKAVSYLAP